MKLLALTGNATCGKDSAFNILAKHLPVQRVAFADALKRAVNPLCQELFSISAFTNDPKEKEIIRNILVCVGNTARMLNENVWVDKVRPLIRNITENNYVAVITDCRFVNECNFIQDELGGTLVHLDRIMQDGSLLGPANTSEEVNYPKMKSRANIHIQASNLDELDREVTNKIIALLKSETIQ